MNAFLALAALTAAILIIISGIQFIASRGDQDAAMRAKQTLLYATVGLVVISLSAVLINFFISAAV